MKLWLDDVRPAPKGYVWYKSVNSAINFLDLFEQHADRLKQLCHYEEQLCSVIKCELIDMDHDAGVYAWDGGDYIRLLDWLEETGRNYPIRIHSANPVGVANMRRIIERNGWKEVEQ